MTAPVEGKLAEKTVMALTALPVLAGFKVYANWGEEYARRKYDEGGCKDPRVVDVYVKPRQYEQFTTAVATVEIELAGRVDFTSRIMRVKPEDAYLEIVGLLEEWNGSISAVKEALGSEFFDPVGMRLDGGGEWEVDQESKALNFTVPFTVKGRVKRTVTEDRPTR